MAREEWEDEDYDDEEEDDIEEFDLVAEYKRSIRDLIRKRRKYEPESKEYMVLTQRIADETENLNNAESAENQKAQRITAEKNRYVGLLSTVGNFVGSFGGQMVSTMMNRKNVKTVVGCEDEGGIVKSAATKFIK